MRKKILALSAILIIICASGAYAITKSDNNKSYSSASDLTDDEMEGLLFMREEEKLARDVYLALYEEWDNPNIFLNIATSEQRHMDSIKSLLDKYGLDDPAEGKGFGEFTNQELQSLYNELVAEGEQSLIDALTVGGKIEEIDIIDLKEYIEQTDELDIKTVYNNLLEGSKSHSRAFVKVLEKQGVTYAPFYLSQEEFDDIINGGNGRTQSMGSNQKLTIRNRIRNMIENILEECNGTRNIFRNRNWR